MGKKEKPNSTNEVFNYEARNVKDAIGIDIDSINERMEKVFGGDGGMTPIQACEQLFKNFGHKELAFMAENAIRGENQAKSKLAQMGALGAMMTSRGDA